MLLCVFLSKVTLDKKSGNGIWTAILAVMTFRDWSCTVLNELWNWSPVVWWIGRKTKLYATRSFRPMWLRQIFFCLKRITNGITHPPTKKAKVTVEYKRGTRVTTNKCTDVQVDLGLGCTYCRMWYRKLLGTTASEQKVKTCAERQEWVVPSTRSRFAKNAGEKDMINMHS